MALQMKASMSFLPVFVSTPATSLHSFTEFVQVKKCVLFPGSKPEGSWKKSTKSKNCYFYIYMNMTDTNDYRQVNFSVFPCLNPIPAWVSQLAWGRFEEGSKRDRRRVNWKVGLNISDCAEKEILLTYPILENLGVVFPSKMKTCSCDVRKE